MKKSMVAVGTMIAGVAVGGLAGTIAMGMKNEKQEEKLKKRTDKFYGYFHLVNQWLVLKNEGKSLKIYFEKNNYKKIALYGMGELGNRLFEELKGSNVEISYAIDQKADRIYSDVKVVTIEDRLEPVDVIVVTPIFDYDEIEELLMDRSDCPVVSLEDVVFDVE